METKSPRSLLLSDTLRSKTLTIELEESTEAQMAMPLRGHHSLVYLRLEKTRLTHSMVLAAALDSSRAKIAILSYFGSGAPICHEATAACMRSSGWSESKNGRSCCSMGTAAVPNDPRVAMEPNRMCRS